MNAAFGQLMIDIPVKSLMNNLQVKSLPRAGKQVISLVIKHSEQYYHNPKYYEAINKIIDKQAGEDYEV
jgi:hypothetical protein